MIRLYSPGDADIQEMRSAQHPMRNTRGYFNLLQGFRWVDDSTLKVRGGTELYLAAPVAGATLIDWWSGELNGTVYLVEAVLSGSKIRIYASESGGAFYEVTEVGGWSGGTDGDTRFSTNTGRVGFTPIKMPQGFVAGAILPSRDVLLIHNGADYNRIWDPGLTASSTLTISSVADNGGLIRATTTTNHNRQTGDTVVITGAAGAIAANLNGSWTVTKVSDTVIELQGSTYVSGYTSSSATISNHQRLTVHQPVTVPTGARAGFRAVHTFQRFWQCAGSAGTNKYATGTLINQTRWRFRDGAIDPYGSGSNVVPEWDATVDAATGDIATVRFSSGLSVAEAVHLILEDQSSGVATFDDLIRNSRLEIGTGNFGSYAAVSGAANNGAGLIRITATAHGFSTGNSVTITGVTGTTEANGTWTITVISANTFDLVGSTFTNAYVSGGHVVNNSVTWVEIHDPADSDRRNPEKNVLADGIDNPSIDPPEVAMFTFKLGHLTAAQLAATYYHLKATRIAGHAPQDTTTAMLLNVVTGGSAPGGSEFTLTYEDQYGHCESSRIVGRNDEAALLRDCGGPVTLYDYRLPISSSVLYDFDIWAKNAGGATSITGGLNGEPSRFNLYLRAPGETVALYWFSVKLYDVGAVSTSRGWGKIDTANEYVFSAATSKIFNTGDATSTYTFDWTARDSGRHAPSDFHIGIPICFCSCYANGRLFVGNIIDDASQNQRGEIYFSKEDHPFNFQSVVESSVSGGRTVLSGERIQALFTTAAAAQNRSFVFALSNRRLASIGGSGPFEGSSSDAVDLTSTQTLSERGTNAHRSVVVAKDGPICWVDDTGQAVRFDGGRPVPISKGRFDNVFASVPAARRDDIQGVFFDERVRWVYSLSGRTVNEQMIGWNDAAGKCEFDDNLTGTLPTEAERVAVLYDSSANGSGLSLLLGKSSGAVYKFEVPGKGDDGSSDGSVACRIVTGDVVPGDPQSPYLVDFVAMELEPQDATLTIKRICRSPDSEYQTQVTTDASDEVGWVTDETKEHTENDAPADDMGERGRGVQLDITGDLQTGSRVLMLAAEVLDYSTQEAVGT